MYYIMKCPKLCNSAGEVYTEIHNSFRIAGIRLWTNGQPLPDDKKKEIPNPIEILFDVFRGYNGPPREYTDTGIPVMSKRLRDTLSSLGVDNIDFFPTILTNSSTAETYPYYAYKIVGLVSLADMQKSEFVTYRNSAPVIDVSFQKLVFDHSKGRGQLLFRLAESTSTIVVHETVKQGIEKAGINTIEFFEPES